MLINCVIANINFHDPSDAHILEVAESIATALDYHYQCTESEVELQVTISDPNTGIVKNFWFTQD